MTSCLYHSGAKVNLYLRVGLPRQDGFHPVLTLLAALDLEETLRFDFAAREGLQLEVRGADLGDPEQNLVTRAIRLASEAWKLGNPGIRVLLEKRLPHQAGLGAGSANAAAALMAISTKFNPQAPMNELMELGAILGADVPFFLLGGYAIGRGRGSELESIPSELKLPLLLLKPTSGIGTAEAYQELDGLRNSSSSAALGAREDEDLAELSQVLVNPGASPRDLAKLLVNDFHQPLSVARPWLGEAERALLEVGALRVLLSGSGSALFGLFETPEGRDQAAMALEGRGDWTAYKANTGVPGLRREETPCVS